MQIGLTLEKLVKEHEWNSIEMLGMVIHVVNLLHMDLDERIKADPKEIQHRRDAYKYDLYPHKFAHYFYLFFFLISCRKHAGIQKSSFW